MHQDLRSFIEALRREGEIIEVTCPVDPFLEIAEIHRRVIEQGGKALLFTNVKGSSFPVVTNLFGTKRRIDLAFGSAPENFVRSAVRAIDSLLPPRLSSLWTEKKLLTAGLKLGTKRIRSGPVLDVTMEGPNLEDIPLLQLWPEDGGHFVTLPLVYTESPVNKKHNLGMYRIQRYDKVTTGIHWQIGKGGGFHHFEAEERGEALPVTIFLGGPPALMLAAIAPLPEDVPELMLASLLAGGKLGMVDNPERGGHRLVAGAEFAICGEVVPRERRPEGPFGDHYGYYSLIHPFPVFKAKSVFHRRDAIYPATVVGKPRQEDFFIGDYLQELLSPLFPLVMPQVLDLWNYGETGFHSLAAAVVRERYSREALSAGFRILGEGQLSLTKFLLLTDMRLDLKDFRKLFEHILERMDPATDLFVFDRTSFDTLDYTSGKFNLGSKAIMVGVGEKKRDLRRTMPEKLPQGVRAAEIFCGGCIVIEAEGYENNPSLLDQLIRDTELQDFQLVVLHDEIKYARRVEDFLWATWTRFNPSTDMRSREVEVVNNHVRFGGPIGIDARMKPWHPKEVEPAPETVRLVNERWSEYFER